MSYGIVEIPEKGRGIVATKDLKDEEVLFTEVPVCSAQMSWGVKLGYLGRFRYTVYHIQHHRPWHGPHAHIFQPPKSAKRTNNRYLYLLSVCILYETIGNTR